MIGWRRDIIEPSRSGWIGRISGNRDWLPQHVRTLCLDVRTGVARTGVAILKGGKPGRTVVAARSRLWMLFPSRS